MTFTSRRRCIRTGILLLLFAVVSQLSRINAAAQSMPADTARSVVTPQENIDSKKVKESVSEALDIIKKNHVDGKHLNYPNVFKWTITASLRTLDPYSTYFDAKEYSEFRLNPPIAGIGIKLQDHVVGGERRIFVHSALQGSPAAITGLRFGDEIIKIDNWDSKGRSLAEVVKKLQGPRDSRVKITIERGGEIELQTIEVIRASFSQSPVRDAYMIEAGVGYIDLRTDFNWGSGEAFSDKLQELHKKGMAALVLDLRNNRGGLMIESVRVANQFLPVGQLILTQSSRKTNYDAVQYKSINSNPDKSPVVVLVNERTSSAPEIVSGALQDHKRALIVGETTFGHGLIQFPYELKHGSALLLTISKSVTPSGRFIQGDYSNLSFYSTGSAQRIEPGFGGSRGGIEPDEVVRSVKISSEQQLMVDLVFGFARGLVNGRIAGFNSYQVRNPVDFSHDLKPDEFPITDSLFNAFKEFVAKDSGYKLTDKQLDTNREFITRQLRYNIAMAFYGSLTADRILKAGDPQILKAIEAIPRAAKLVPR